jgi:hypothetical protein
MYRFLLFFVFILEFSAAEAKPSSNPTSQPSQAQAWQCVCNYKVKVGRKVSRERIVIRGTSLAEKPKQPVMPKDFGITDKNVFDTKECLCSVLCNQK